ncbi:Chemotaxis protein CheW [Anaerolineae bacterium]|nr:Chemotaxis protein CheW [Anaerolineae bacterium]
MGKDQAKTRRSFNQDPFADILDDERSSIKSDAESQPVQPEPVAIDANGDEHPNLVAQIQSVVPQWLAATIANVTNSSPASAKPKTTKAPSRRRKKTISTELLPSTAEPWSSEQQIERVTLPVVDLTAPQVSNRQDEPIETTSGDSSVASECEMTLDTLLNSLIQDSDSAFPEPTTLSETLPSDALVEQPSAFVQVSNESDTLLENLIDRIDSTIEETPALATATQVESFTATRATGATSQYIIFSLHNTDYATPLGNVIEIERLPAVTFVPNMPEWVMGVTNLRGDIVSMVDLRRFLGVGQSGYTPNARVLIAQTNTGEVTIGFYVDRVTGVRALVTDQIKPPTAAIEDRVTAYLQGIYEHEGGMVIVLDFNKLLLSPEIRQFEMA